jgi:hypothetical protein
MQTIGRIGDRNIGPGPVSVEAHWTHVEHEVRLDHRNLSTRASKFVLVQQTFWAKKPL